MIWVLVVYYCRDTRRETNNIYAIHFAKFGMLRLTRHAKPWTNGIRADLSRDGIDV